MDARNRVGDRQILFGYQAHGARCGRSLDQQIDRQTDGEHQQENREAKNLGGNSSLEWHFY